MTKGVAAAFQQAANDDNKPIMVVIDTTDSELAFQLADELRSRAGSDAFGAVIIDMTPENTPEAEDAKVLKYTKRLSQAVAQQQPIIAVVDLSGQDEANHRVAVTSIALGLNYDVRAYHVIPATADTDEPPVMSDAGAEEAGLADLSWHSVSNVATAQTAAQAITGSAGKSRPGRNAKTKKPGKGGMGK